MSEPALLETLIVDDEPMSRAALRVRVREHPDLVLAGEAIDGRSALAALRELKPQLVFLDVQMPGLDGFALLDQLEDDALPAIIFVTAYDNYAVRAFDVHASDYLLKPFDGARFNEAVRRARLQLAACAPEAELGMLESAAGSQACSRFLVRQGGRMVLVKAADLDYLEAAANYVRLHARGQVYRVRGTLRDIEKLLDPAQFARIHRGTIVNIDRIGSFEPAFNGDYYVFLQDGAQLRLSRQFRKQLFETGFLNSPR